MNRHLTHILSALALSLATATAWADNNRGADNNASANNTTTYYINAPRFVRPILSQWISDYEQSHGGVRFAIAKTAETRQNSALDILTSESEIHFAKPQDFCCTLRHPSRRSQRIGS